MARPPRACEDRSLIRAGVDQWANAAVDRIANALQIPQVIIGYLGAAFGSPLFRRRANQSPSPDRFTGLPAAIGAIAYQNKAKVYGLLLKAAADTLTAIAADRRHLGAHIGVTAVLHTWGQNLDQNPHSRYRALSSP
jgi:hypothetical protein